MNRFIICAFEITEESTPLAYTQTVFYSGLQVMGQFITQEIEKGDGFATELKMYDLTPTEDTLVLDSEETASASPGVAGMPSVHSSIHSSSPFLSTNPSNSLSQPLSLSSEAVRFLPESLVTYFDDEYVS